MTESPAYSIERIWSHCPTLAEGRTRNDHPFFFIAEAGIWSIIVGPCGAATCYEFWWRDPHAGQIAGGLDASGGRMRQAQVYAIVDDVFQTHLAHL